MNYYFCPLSASLNWLECSMLLLHIRCPANPNATCFWQWDKLWSMSPVGFSAEQCSYTSWKFTSSPLPLQHTHSRPTPNFFFSLRFHDEIHCLETATVKHVLPIMSTQSYLGRRGVWQPASCCAWVAPCSGVLASAPIPGAAPPACPAARSIPSGWTLGKDAENSVSPGWKHRSGQFKSIWKQRTASENRSRQFKPIWKQV